MHSEKGLEWPVVHSHQRGNWTEAARQICAARSGRHLALNRRRRALAGTGAIAARRRRRTRLGERAPLVCRLHARAGTLGRAEARRSAAQILGQAGRSEAPIASRMGYRKLRRVADRDGAGTGQRTDGRRVRRSAAADRGELHASAVAHAERCGFRPRAARRCDGDRDCRRRGRAYRGRGPPARAHLAQADGRGADRRDGGRCGGAGRTWGRAHSAPSNSA